MGEAIANRRRRTRAPFSVADGSPTIFPGIGETCATIAATLSAADGCPKGCELKEIDGESDSANPVMSSRNSLVTLFDGADNGPATISGITVVGAIIAAGYKVTGFGSFFGMVAIVLAMINVVGGFLVTHRMLLMFKKR